MRSGWKSGLVGLLTGAMLFCGGCGKSNSTEDAGVSIVTKATSPIKTENVSNSSVVVCPDYWDLAAADSFRSYLPHDQRALLQPNVFIKDFPQRIIFCEKREGSVLYNVRIIDESDKKTREIRADTAEIKGGENGPISLMMSDVRVPVPSGLGDMMVDRMQYTLPDLRLASSRGNPRPEGSVRFDVFGQEYFARFFPSNKSKAGKNNEFSTAIHLNYNSSRPVSSSINFDASKMYLVSSCPLDNIRVAQHIAKLVFSGNEASFESETIPGESVFEADKKTSERILSLMIDFSSLGRLSRGSKVYCVASGNNEAHRSGMTEIGASGAKTRWDGLGYGGDFSYSDDAARAGVTFAVVADFIFNSNATGEIARRDIVSFINYAPPHFKEIDGYWDIPSERRIFGFNDGWIFKADTPFIYDDRNHVTHYATTAILGKGGQILLNGIGSKELIEVVSGRDGSASVIYHNGESEEVLVRSKRYTKNSVSTPRGRKD